MIILYCITFFDLSHPYICHSYVIYGIPFSPIGLVNQTKQKKNQNQNNNENNKKIFVLQTVADIN